jgi:hypothetical protein
VGGATHAVIGGRRTQRQPRWATAALKPAVAADERRTDSLALRAVTFAAIEWSNPYYHMHILSRICCLGRHHETGQGGEWRGSPTIVRRTSKNLKKNAKKKKKKKKLLKARRARPQGAVRHTVPLE